MYLPGMFQAIQSLLLAEILVCLHIGLVFSEDCSLARIEAGRLQPALESLVHLSP